MNQDKYSAYCREHVTEFRDELRDDASWALRNWPARTSALLLLVSSLLTWQTLLGSNNPYAGQALLTYSIPILIVLLFPWITLLFSTTSKLSRSVFDCFVFSILFGFCMTLQLIFRPELSEQEQSNYYIALSGQINFVILMTTAFSYHTRFEVTLLRNTVFTLLTVLMIYRINAAYLTLNIMQLVQGYLGGIIVGWLFFRRIQSRFYYKSVDADTRQHLYNQLSKLVYPHQLERIKSGDQLEETMPVARSEAIINVFDIKRSSDIRHERTQDFFLNVFRAFSQICMMGYRHNPLKSRAFRLKETGDGFISAVGYPFMTEKSMSLADHAVDTALMMFKAFNAEVDRFSYGHPIKAAMGLAFNTVQGTFQSSGIRAYDLYGDALVQAYRYEEMRKNPQIASIMDKGALQQGLEDYNILIVQEVIYNSLCDGYKSLFQPIDLKAIEYPMPQDPNARFVYFHILP